MWRYTLLAVILFSTLHSTAQEISFSAVASAGKIGINDQVQVDYRISNTENIKTVSPPDEIYNDFHIVGGPFPTHGIEASVVNGQVTQTRSLTLSYVLQPKRKGRLTIPAGIAETVEGAKYQSNSLPLEVVDGSLAQQQQRQRPRSPFDDPFFDDPFEAFYRRRRQQQQALQQQRQQQQQRQVPQANEDGTTDMGKDLFIKVTVDKDNVHVGEQITATYKLYARVPMNVSISKLPTLNGFWTQDFDMPNGNIKPVEEIVNGQKYQVFTLKKSALFPQQTGTLELDPAEAEGMARIVSQTRTRDPFFDDPFFESFMMNDPFIEEFFSRGSYQDVRVKLRSKPVKIKVSPLPVEEQPKGYGGAVGNFTISSSIDKKELTTDDVTNLKVTIKGSGNIKLIEPPVLNLPNGLIAYDPVVQDTITGRTTTISGTKTITYTITPRNKGSYNIKPLEFSYYNPNSGQYVTLKTDSIRLKVKQGTGANDKNKKTLLTDIHNIEQSNLNNITFNSKPLIFTAGYWSMYLLPLVVFAGLLFRKRREDELAKDIVSLKRRRANRIALKRLTTAKKLLKENQRTPFYEEVSKAIWLYLSDKLNIPLSSLSKENVWDALRNKNISEELQSKLRSVMEDCEIALYSGTGGVQKMQETYDNAVSVISKTEEAFR